jgi:hypothetical protein
MNAAIAIDLFVISLKYFFLRFVDQPQQAVHASSGLLKSCNGMFHSREQVAARRGRPSDQPVPR